MEDGGYFYCYNKRLFSFLKVEKALDYTATGLNQNSHNRFWQFKRSAELSAAIDEYKNTKLIEARREKLYEPIHEGEARESQVLG